MKNNIASERVRRDWSQDDLASRLKVSREAVKNWESGETAIKSSKLVEMADLFGCSIDYLLGRCEERLLSKVS